MLVDSTYNRQGQDFRKGHGKPYALRPEQHGKQQEHRDQKPYPAQEHERQCGSHALDALAVAYYRDIGDEERYADGTELMRRHEADAAGRPDAPVKLIAHELRFDDVSYMCRYFRRMTGMSGMSPTEYRKSL